jgi:hypothetical protein
MFKFISIPRGICQFLPVQRCLKMAIINKRNLNPKDWVSQQYSIFSEETLRYLENRADELYKNTDLCIVGEFVDAGFGDVSKVPGPAIRSPKGIREPVK